MSLNKKITRIKKEIGDTIHFIRHDNSLDAAAMRAMIVASAILLLCLLFGGQVAPLSIPHTSAGCCY